MACGDPGAHVWGVIFEILDDQKPALDRIEGLGRGYDQVRLPVTTPDGETHHAWLYRADPSAIDPDIVPFRWYVDLVLAGAREHGLPDDYVRRHIVGHPRRPRRQPGPEAPRARAGVAVAATRCSASPPRSR